MKTAYRVGLHVLSGLYPFFRSYARLYSTQQSLWCTNIGSSSSATTTHIENRPVTKLPRETNQCNIQAFVSFQSCCKNPHNEEAKPSLTRSVLLSLSHIPPSPCWTLHWCDVSGVRAAAFMPMWLGFVKSGATPCVRTEAPLLLNPGQTFFPPWWWGRRGDQTVVDGGSELVLILVVATVQKMRFTEETFSTVA